MNINDLKLYLVTDRSLCRGRQLEYIVEEALKGGVTMVQLREKECSTREFYEIGMRLKALLSSFDIPLVINDRLDVALAINADGLHIGQSDMPWYEAQRLLGTTKILGISVETMEQVITANEIDVDYIGISPVFATSTKIDTFPPFGLEGVKEACMLSRHPCVAIGGINLDNAQQIMKNGASGIAVVSAISMADDPRKAANELLKEILVKS